MNKYILTSFFLLACVAVEASWFWPFGGGGGNRSRPRVSELMEPVSILIDDASDLAAEGKTSEAVSKYREAIAELNRVEQDNADRVDTAAFATLRNKRAYVNAAIDSLLLREARQNARAVSVTDTTELERRRAAERSPAAPAAPAPAASAAPAAAPENAERIEELEKELAAKPGDRRLRLLLVAENMNAHRFEPALTEIQLLLAERANDPAAMNLQAAVEVEMGDVKSAENTLDQTIRRNPESYYAYYNMARLILRTRGESGKSAARGYYEAGRRRGGPADKSLEDRL